MLPTWIRAYRFVLGFTALIAVFYNWRTLDDPHFFSFFTNQSGILAGVVLVLGAFVFARRGNPMWWDIFRGCAVISMLVTGIVFAVLLDGLYNPFTTTEHNWGNSVLHQLMPIVMLLDVLIVPLHPRTPRWTVALYLLFPLAYLGTFLYSGSKDNWYPYDFIDHTTYTNGYTGVLTTCGILLVVFIVIGLVLVQYSRMRRIPGSPEIGW